MLGMSRWTVLREMVVQWRVAEAKYECIIYQIREHFYFVDSEYIVRLFLFFPVCLCERRKESVSLDTYKKHQI
jgi:hypothetical protein